MAFRIVASCVNCWACESVCPQQAVEPARPHFRIDPRRCTQCEGDYPVPQCASICPVEGAILDAAGAQVNPPGSLTGIPPARLDAMRREIGAR